MYFSSYNNKITLENVPITDLCTIKARIGWQGLTTKEYLNSGDFFLITGVDFTEEHNVDFNNCHYVSKERYDQDENIQIHKNDILISKDGTLGKIALINEEPKKPTTLNGGVFVLRIIDERVLLRYLFYFLQSPIFSKFIDNVKSGSTVPHLTQKNLTKLNIPIPQKSVQELIISTLDAVFGKLNFLKEIVDRQLENVSELYKSRLNSYYLENSNNWVQNSLKEITTKIGSGATPNGGKKSYKTTGVSLIRSLNVYDNGFKTENLAHIDDEQADKLDYVTISENDILINITGASIARCCIVPIEYIPARVNQHVSIIRVKKDIICPEFLHYLLISPNYKNHLLGIGEDGGTTRQALTKKALEELIITYPQSISEQRRIVFEIEEMEKKTLLLSRYYSEKLQMIEGLRKSILNAAFHGELIR